MADLVSPPKPKSEGDRIEGLLDVLNPGDRVLVYRIVVDPTTGKETRPIKANLSEFQGVEDLEAWLYDMAAEQHWPAGEYLLDHRKAGVHGSHCHARLSVEPPPAPPSAAANGGQAGALELVRQARELAGPQPTASPDKILDTVTAALKIGSDNAAAKAAPQDSTLVLLKPVLEALAKKLGEVPPAPAPPPDPFAFLERLKLLGVIGKQTSTDKPKPLVEQISEIEELVSALGRLAGPAGPAVEPTAVAVAKIVAPYLPQVLATINNIVDVTRLRFGLSGPLLHQPSASPTTPRAVGPPQIPPAVQVLIARTQAAIAADNDGFFPAFAEGITVHIVDGRNFLLDIQSGTIEEEQAVLAVQGTGLLNPAEPRTRAWLIRFVHWLRAAKPMAAATPEAVPGSTASPAVNAVLTRCERCQQEYRFDSREDFEQDTRICDNETEGVFCKGNITLVSQPFTNRFTDGSAP